jgi:general secretion pathway protein L
MPAVDLLSPLLSRFRALYAQTSLPRFLAWWGGELRACLPQRWRKLLASEDARILIQREADVLRVSQLRAGQLQDVAQLPLAEADALPAALDQALGEERRELPRVLLLPAAMVLRRVLTLPSAALDNLRTVLGFELDRQTPFKPDQVTYDSRVLAHETGARQVPVELALVPRERLRQVLDEIGPVASDLSGVDAGGADGVPLGYNFLPAEQRRSGSHARLWLHLGLIAFSAFCLLLAMHRLIDNRAEAVAALGSESEKQHDGARVAARLRSTLEEAATAANFLAVEKARQPSMVLLLNELSVLLPDDTWLERMNFSRGEVSLAGQSGQAAKLVEILQGSTLLRNPALSGPIQPDARSGKDRFNITAGYGPGTDEAEDSDATVARR